MTICTTMRASTTSTLTLTVGTKKSSMLTKPEKRASVQSVTQCSALADTVVKTSSVGTMDSAAIKGALENRQEDKEKSNA